jgi:hypothetical protein
MRHFELQLLDDKGNGISLTDLKVTFSIQKMPATIFNGFVGDFKIYNLSPATQNRIMAQEFSRIQVIAGYDGNPDEAGNYPDRNVGLIFNGDIRFTVAGKDNITDSWVMVQCIDSWQGHLYAGVRTTVAAGWKYKDLFEAGMQSYQPYGISAGSVPDFPDTVFPRGRVLVGNTSDLMNSIAGKCDANWWYENNQVNIVPESKYIDEVIVLNVYRTALSIDQIAGKQGAGGMLKESATDGNLYVDGVAGSQPAAINTDGDYTVGSIDYTGDTRGNSWYMDLLCLAKGAKELQSLSTINKVG